LKLWKLPTVSKYVSLFKERKGAIKLIKSNERERNNGERRPLHILMETSSSMETRLTGPSSFKF
jgi:hypothetical protein